MRDFVIIIALLLQRLPMKQLAILVAIFVLGSLGSLYHPIWAITLYYLLAVLRPQYLWKWALPVEWRWSFLAAIIVLISVLLHLPRMMSRLRVNLVVWLTLGYGIWLTISVLTAYDPTTAQAYGFDVAKILLMAIITGIVVNRVRHVKILAATLLIVLGYIAWEINSLYITQGRLDVFHYGYGGLDNNGAGLLLAMGIPFAYAFGIGATRMWQRLLIMLVSLLLLHAVLMTYSRGAMVAACVGVIWLLVQHRSRVQAAVIALILGVAVSLLAGQEIRYRFFSLSNYQTDVSAQSRIGSWIAAWNMAWDHPMTGKGIRNASRYSHNYGADSMDRTIHSQYLQIAADSGIPAMVLFTIILGTSIVYFRRSRIMCRDQLEQDAEGDHYLDDADRRQFSLMEMVALGCQTSLIIFAVGACFLSLETFELPWLLMALAGVLPRAVQHEIEQLAASADAHRQKQIHPVHEEHVQRLRSGSVPVLLNEKSLARI